MKSFNQFLQESYLNEEPAGRVRSPKEQAEWDKINEREAAAAERKANRKPSGAAADSTKQFKPQGTTTTVPGSNVRGGTEKAGALALRPKSGALATTPKSSSALATTPKTGNLANKSSSSVVDASIKPVNVSVLNGSKGKLPSGGKPPTGSSAKNAVKTADTALTAAGNASKLGKIAKFAGPASAALDTALSTADERSKGSGWARSLAKGATVAAGGLLGGTAGAIGGGGLLSAATGTAGALAGGAAAEKAFDTAAGANAVQRKAIATANRKSQAGGAIKGIGGPTSFDTKKNTITTGTGAQRKTAQLGKTSVVTGPGGKQEVGNLAYKGGQAVYKRAADPSTLAKTSSNPLERIGRSLFAGAYKQSDAANATKKLATARQSDAARNKALGVKFGPGK